MLSLSKHPLIGEKLARFVYLDETGTNKKDPFLIVAGIFIDPDKGLRMLDVALQKAALELIPESLLLSEMSIYGKFTFHAVDYMNGNKNYKELKEEGKWSFDDGYKVAEAIISAAENSGASIVWGAAPNNMKVEKKYRHSSALAQTLRNIELHMFHNHPGENCIIVAENIDEHKKAIKQTVNTITNGVECIKVGLGSPFPLRTIRDTVHFVSKRESIGCQVADTICYVLKKMVDEDDRYSELGTRVLALSLI